MAEANWESGEWVFIDIGFSASKKSCGLLLPSNDSRSDCEFTFEDLTVAVLDFIGYSPGSINLLIEAPLSVAFKNGNPAGRSFEFRKGKTPRYWYSGVGATVLTATTYLLRSIHDAKPSCEIRLFEGFASFKPRGAKSDHYQDVCDLRALVRGDTSKGRIVSPEEIRRDTDGEVQSAFKVARMDLGIPPVVILGDPSDT
jgi:hypothetical protein